MKVIIIRVLLAIALIALFTSLNASGNMENLSNLIKGKVIDASSGEPIDYVNVAIYKAADSSLVTGSLTDSLGKFSIKRIPSGEYYADIIFIGFEKIRTNKFIVDRKNNDIDLGEIKLYPSTSQINDVVVTAEKSRVEYKIDKRVINVDKDLSAKGGTAVNALENTPSVQVDPQGNLTLRGSSDYIVLVDGKPSVIKGSELLKQIPSSAIKQIEVITNPSAKYDAEGKAGIINIVMRKDRLQGLNGNINASIGNTDKQNASLTLNYRRNKINYFGGITYNDFTNNSYLDINNKTFISTGDLYISEKVHQFNNNSNLGVRAGIDCDINEKNNFSISGSIDKQGYDNGSASKYNFRNIPETYNTYGKSSIYTDVEGYAPQFTLDYTYKFAENKTLTISNNFSAWVSGTVDNTMIGNTTDNNYKNETLASKLNYLKKESNNNFRTNIDYKQPFAGGNFETGLQYRYEYRYENMNFKNFDIAHNTWLQNDTFTYVQDYYNSIYSGYITYSNKIWGIGYMLGLRSEYFQRDIQITNKNTEYEYNKFMFYPSIHFSKEFTGNQQVQLSYSRRINRPQPWILNSTPSYIDPLNIFEGNPYLIPEFTDAYELNYRKSFSKITLSAQTYYRHTTNSFNSLRLMDDKGIMHHRLTNSKSQDAAGLELGVDINLLKWWQINTGTNLYNYVLETVVDTVVKNRNINTWDARFVSSFSLPWQTRIQFVEYYRAAGVDAQGNTQGFFVTNIAINQSLLKNKASFGVSIQNAFKTLDFDYTVKSSRFDNKYNIRIEGPTVMLNFTYNFNNFQNKQRGRADDASFKGAGAF